MKKMKIIIKTVLTGFLVCLMAFVLLVQPNKTQNSENIDLLSFSMQNAQAHGEDTNHNHGPTVNPVLSPLYCGNTNQTGCAY